MKSITILGLACLLSTGASAQQLINQKDPFTGKQVKAAMVTLGGTFTNIGQMFGFAEKDGKKFVNLLWMPSMSGADVNGLNFDAVDIKKCSILIKMDDDTMIKFAADSTLSKKTGNGTSAALNIGAYLTDEQLISLKTHYVKTIRLGLTDDNVGVDLSSVNDKASKQIQKAAVFMLASN